MTELLQLDPGEVEELASECDMGYAFRQRLVRGHQVLRDNNQELIRQLTEGGLDADTARQRANEDWSRRQPWNQRSPPMRSKPDQYGKGTAFLESSSSSDTTRYKKDSSLLSQVKALERAQFNERLHDRLLRLQKSDSLG